MSNNNVSIMELKETDENSYREELTKYLEFLFIKKAIDDFLINKPDFSRFDNIIKDKWYKYISLFTKTWLSYLDNNQFNNLVKRKIKTKLFPKTTSRKVRG